MIDAAGEGRIMVKQVPLILKFNNRMMGRPADNRRQDNTFINEGAFRIFTHGIDKLMG
ncbi:hypothetical protein D3C85_1818450 [compost metagenome]